MFMPEINKSVSLEGGFSCSGSHPLGFRYLDSTVCHNFTLASYYRRLLLVAMGASLLVFIIYALFHNYILLFLPVDAKFQQPIADANASSILVSTSSSTTSTVTVVPTTQPTQTIDPSITQSIKTIQTRRISSIIGTMSSPNSISSWCVPRIWVLKY